MIESYQDEMEQRPPEIAPYSFASVGEVYEDGVSLIFPGEAAPSEKHYKVNTLGTYAAGQRVKVIKDSGTYIVEYPIGNLGGNGGEGGDPQTPSETPALKRYSWAEIEKIAHGGKATQYWAVGDRKALKIGSVNYMVEIVGFDHDEYSDATGKSPITFGLVNCLRTTYQMNHEATNAGGWEGSAFRSVLNGQIYNQIQNDAKEIIKPVKKLTSGGNTSTEIIQSRDFLFLFSAEEVTGSANSYSASGEGKRYDRFSRKNDRIREMDGEIVTWGLRSPGIQNSNLYCIITVNQSVGGVFANTWQNIAFGFGI